MIFTFIEHGSQSMDCSGSEIKVNFLRGPGDGTERQQTGQTEWSTQCQYQQRKDESRAKY